MILCGIDVAGNGLLIAASKYKNLDRVRNSMGRTLVLLSVFIWQSTSRGWGLQGIWTGDRHMPHYRFTCIGCCFRYRAFSLLAMTPSQH